MSPTASTPPNNVGRDIGRLPAALVESGWAKADDIIGCSESEIEQVQQSAQFPLPDDYVSFLKKMGHRAGRLFQGKVLYFPAMMESPEVADYLAADPRQSLTLDNRFFFGDHQGYIVYFFQKDDPAVYSYQEGHPEDPAHRVADSFAEWAWRYFEWSLELHAENRELFESRQRKREAMGLPREEYHEW